MAKMAVHDPAPPIEVGPVGAGLCGGTQAAAGGGVWGGLVQAAEERVWAEKSCAGFEEERLTGGIYVCDV